MKGAYTESASMFTDEVTKEVVLELEHAKDEEDAREVAFRKVGPPKDGYIRLAHYYQQVGMRAMLVVRDRPFRRVGNGG